MGTRGLIVIKKDKKYRLAKYNHCDSYPSCLGYSIVEFLKKLKNIENFKNQVDYLKMVSTTEFKNYSEEIKEIYYSLDLNDILVADEEIITPNEIEFVKESLCEWAYVIDLDLNTFEIYKGNNKKPLTPGERFYDEKGKGDYYYYPVKLFAKFDLVKLPLYKELKKMDKSDFENKSINNKRKKSEKVKPKWTIFYRCNKCNKESKTKENFCPSCGSKMNK